MAISFEFRIGNLLAKFLTNALVFFRSLQTAGTIATGTL